MKVCHHTPTLEIQYKPYFLRKISGGIKMQYLVNVRYCTVSYARFPRRVSSIVSAADTSTVSNTCEYIFMVVEKSECPNLI